MSMKKGALVFSGLGFELAAVFLAGSYLGTLVDEHMGWKGLGFLVITGSLFVVWITHFVYLIRRFMKNSNESNN